MNSTSSDAAYRKHNDRGLNSSTYHKRDGTHVRAILKEEARKETQEMETNTSEKFTFFWRGPFSQWYPARFVVRDVKYNCAEQYMMAEKARHFGDKETEDRIMVAIDPRLQKKYGRQVQGFIEDSWNVVARDIVFRGNYARFTQNRDLRRKLLATVGTTLVEASPQDPIWGIGLAESDVRVQDRSQWLGTNWLGETLTKVRDQIIRESSDGIQ